jgi:hypothetical protein
MCLSGGRRRHSLRSNKRPLRALGLVRRREEHPDRRHPRRLRQRPRQKHRLPLLRALPPIADAAVGPGGRATQLRPHGPRPRRDYLPDNVLVSVGGLGLPIGHRHRKRAPPDAWGAAVHRLVRGQADRAAQLRRQVMVRRPSTPTRTSRVVVWQVFTGERAFGAGQTGSEPRKRAGPTGGGAPGDADRAAEAGLVVQRRLQKERLLLGDGQLVPVDGGQRRRRRERGRRPRQAPHIRPRQPAALPHAAPAPGVEVQRGQVRDGARVLPDAPGGGLSVRPRRQAQRRHHLAVDRPRGHHPHAAPALPLGAEHRGARLDGERRGPHRAHRGQRVQDRARHDRAGVHDRGRGARRVRAHPSRGLSRAGEGDGSLIGTFLRY